MTWSEKNWKNGMHVNGRSRQKESLTHDGHAEQEGRGGHQRKPSVVIIQAEFLIMHEYTARPCDKITNLQQDRQPARDEDCSSSAMYKKQEGLLTNRQAHAQPIVKWRKKSNGSRLL